MRIPFSKALAAASCMAGCLSAQAQAAEVGGVVVEESVHLAGRQLQLNGAGVSKRLLFQVYAIGLYLQEQRRTTEAVLSSDGPRRLFIRLLRDISPDEFEDALVEQRGPEPTALDARITAQLEHLGRAISSQPRGLRRGDQLTLDWIPGTGTVVALNRRPLAAPLQDIRVYNALLNIWLGEQASDPRLKTVLLGRAPA